MRSFYFQFRVFILNIFQKEIDFKDKNAFQLDAYRPLVDRMPESASQWGVCSQGVSALGGVCSGGYLLGGGGVCSRVGVVCAPGRVGVSDPGVGGVCSQGGSAREGVCSQGGLLLVGLLRGGAAGRVSAPRGDLLLGVSAPGGVSALGGVPQDALRQRPPPCGQNHRRL